MKQSDKYHDLETKPIIGAAGGASLGGLFGSIGIVIGAAIGFFVMLAVVIYLLKNGKK